MGQVRSAADSGFEAAVNANFRRLIGLARAMLGSGLRDAKEPEDLVQDAMLRLFRQRESYDWSDGGWSLMAKSVARNVISCRRRKIGKSIDADEAFMDNLGADMDPAAAAMHAETTAQFRERIEALPEHWRSALVLREQQELSYKEIAELLQASEAQIKTWLHRARARLAGELMPESNDMNRPKVTIKPEPDLDTQGGVV